MPLEELSEQCLDQNLIDDYTLHDHEVTITRQRIVNFTMTHQQGRVFLMKLLKARKDEG